MQFNTRETLESFYQASKSKGLPRVVEPTARYMCEGRDVHGVEHPNPMEMRGYRYLVWGELITTEEIWHSVQREGLRDLCLSFALYKLILRRFAGFPLDESSTAPRQRTCQFIRKVLLSVDMERLFHIIEVELHFVFDFFYTVSHVCSSYRLIDMWRHIGIVVTLCLFSFVGVSLVSADSRADSKLFSIRYHGHSLEIGITRIVIIIFVFLDTWKSISIWFLNRKMVWSLCTGLRQAAANEGCGMIVFIWTTKDSLYRQGLFGFNPWKRTPGQYSFLESYSGVPMFTGVHKTFMNRLVKIPRIGQKGDTIVALSKEVKRAIVSSLLGNGDLVLSRGTATMTRHNNTDHPLPQELADACTLESNAHVILVWHIATGFCESLGLRPPAYNNGQEHFHVATQLSKHCTYLVAFAPELLPDHPYATECVFDKAVEQAHENVVGLTMEQRYRNLLTRNDVALDVDYNTVVKGAVLTGKLINEVIGQNLEKGWRFLAEFWAELLLYLAPSDNVAAHGEYLAKEGEFITHLWALLTHAGAVTRN